MILQNLKSSQISSAHKLYFLMPDNILATVQCKILTGGNFDIIDAFPLDHQNLICQIV